MKWGCSLLRFFNRKIRGFFCKEDSKDKDVARIVFSSRLLQVSEFRFFEIAYVQWYGKELPVKYMENIFDDYMFRNEVPCWVRHFARQTIAGFMNETLDPKKYNVNYRSYSNEIKGAPSACTILFLFIYFVIFLIFSGYIHIN